MLQAGRVVRDGNANVDVDDGPQNRLRSGHFRAVGLQEAQPPAPERLRQPQQVRPQLQTPGPQLHRHPLPGDVHRVSQPVPLARGRHRLGNPRQRQLRARQRQGVATSRRTVIQIDFTLK